MHITATLHVHPACTSNRKLIEQLQSTTGCLIIIHNNKPKLVAKNFQPFPLDPNGGGHAA
ncbi:MULTISPECIES: hypothetical protein [Pseudomonas]|uniref:hypothetical protein n=1 Tax=Pseudomonas TaxID=286 RepID=UPI000B356546|nr:MULTISPECIES: hypothetical protein [Pseudomonas]PMY56129.1 hypothetical protein C1X70_02725 [Pseudomonas sp. FW305-53]PMY88996.1 hypothetical protein C1X68_01345 [Pseudomonas sp. FW303-C2]PMY92177.1 hypothetical protein C1X67_15040 [Pseudomonas sp. FW305-62]PNA46250.1 hypothetical protein C1X71_02025 [Pseudomonas sp. FW306-2-2C-A10BC]PNA89045.1 hypothetical protein C1X66_02485 [Pseudomonas sp. MPR-R3B]